jgi:hypothetical protein
MTFIETSLGSAQIRLVEPQGSVGL